MPISGDYEYSVIGSNATITKYNGPGGSVTIPATINDGVNTYAVTIIGTDAFANYSSLTSLTIPNSVTSIEKGTFSFCINLASVIIAEPSQLTSIGNYSFTGCYILPSFTIPNRVTSIGYGAFLYCYGLTSVTIPNSVNIINDSAFQYCYNLVATYFFGNAPTMGNNVFRYVAYGFTVYYLYGTTGFSTPTWQPPNTLNNYNAEPFYIVTYDGNGNTSGTVPIDSNTYSQTLGLTVTVLDNTGSLAKIGYTFVGWNTQADGTGTDYAAGANFTMGTANVTLYAKWQEQLGQWIIYSRLSATSLIYNDGDISNNEKMIIKGGYPNLTTIPSTAKAGDTFTVSYLTLNTSFLINQYIKFDFASNITTINVGGTVSFQVFKIYNYNKLSVPVGSVWTFSTAMAVSTTFSFFVYDLVPFNDGNFIYTVVATIQ
ncbi:leucine-rich repeat protein [Clostridium thailandense]|uniref:leucine-rich repeat protein n=1 Tax=Clostridium thailandense TaxID=2794346 RepID=UPI00398A1CBA